MKHEIKVGDFVIYKFTNHDQDIIEVFGTEIIGKMPNGFAGGKLEHLFDYLTYGRTYEVLAIDREFWGDGFIYKILDDRRREEYYPANLFDYDIKKYRKAKLKEIYGKDQSL